MPTITISEDDATQIWDGDHEFFETFHEGEWVDKGKYQHLNIIFQRKSGGTFYRLDIGRSGSYFTDYEFYFTLDCYEVQEVQVIKTEWKVVE